MQGGKIPVARARRDGWGELDDIAGGWAEAYYSAGRLCVRWSCDAGGMWERSRCWWLDSDTGEWHVDGYGPIDDVGLEVDTVAMQMRQALAEVA